MARPRRFPTLVAAALLLAAACGGKGVSLGGTLSQDTSLSFDTFKLLDVTGARSFELRYLRANDIVFDLIIDARDLDLTKPITIDLAEVISGTERASASQSIGGNRIELPAIAKGSISFAQAPRLGTSVDGSFTLDFAPGTGVGGGRSVAGSFNGTLTQYP